MSLLDRLLLYLEARDARAALIGGMALAAYGIARATFDIDMLLTDRRILRTGFWSEWAGEERPCVPGFAA